MNDQSNVILQKKLYFMVEKLKDFHSRLDEDIQNRIPLENLITMANVLANDEHIFDVVGKLNEYQNAAEEMYKKQRDDQIRNDQKEIESYMATLNDNEEILHTIHLLKKQHAQKLKELDKAIIQNLDLLVKEQANTLSILGLPQFFETNDNKQIICQMHLLSFILKLQKLMEGQNFS
ncbi:hypothetical protein PVAND_011098 [Polypedilum vanderplanki]|uniref:Uncharacterized protein n=1 Tax=Polypedilum vanderplanki TaxID=319348 RepID=A0A9J6CJD9_POLVA|nr:hypothetical protein PVAND_011098 [Polypedilum vanderplanki]